MILWLILFLLVVGISFILAYRSMRDYQEIPQKTNVEYGLFLIRQIENFNAEILDSIRERMVAEGLIISLERLFKGKQTALTIFGPKKVIDNFTNKLNLLELEDYTLSLNSNNITTWEVGTKGSQHIFDENFNSIFSNLSELADEDQFFWQLVLSATGKDLSFQTQIRAAVYSEDQSRRKMLASAFQVLGSGKLVKVPKPFSTEQMLSFFKSRSFSKDSEGPVLNSIGVTRLMRV